MRTPKLRSPAPARKTSFAFTARHNTPNHAVRTRAATTACCGAAATAPPARRAQCAVHDALPAGRHQGATAVRDARVAICPRLDAICLWAGRVALGGAAYVLVRLAEILLVRI